MKLLSSLLLLVLTGSCAGAKERVYQASTPAHAVVREFLGISLTDSIDFIRWRVVVKHDRYELACQYGLSKPNTNGFIDEKTVGLSGSLTRQGGYYTLQQDKKSLYLLEINSNLLHLLDQNKNLLVGNGGFSYTLNRDKAVPSDQFLVSFQEGKPEATMVFEGRTPCQELSKLMGLEKSPACNKMKWYIILYRDPVTGQALHYLKGGKSFREEAMARGQWEIEKKADGRVFYKLTPEKGASAVYLLRASDTILLFTDPQGHLLVGNENFSYTLNRAPDR